MTLLFTKLNHELAIAPKSIPTTQELELLNKAIEAARHSYQRFRVGAASERAYACNSDELHAEVNLLLTHNVNREATVAVARLGRKHDWRCSYPCIKCLPVLKTHNIRRLICFNESGQPVAINI